MSDSESVFSTDEFEFDEPEEIQDFEEVDDDVEQTGNLADEAQNSNDLSDDTLQQQAMTPEEKRQARKDQKEARMTRRLLKPHADIIEQSKKIWEQIRSKSTTKKNKQELMSKLMDLVKGKAIDVAITD